MTNKNWELLLDLIDHVIGGTIGLMVFGMIFDGLFNWITIGITGILLFLKVFLDDVVKIESEEES